MQTALPYRFRTLLALVVASAVLNLALPTESIAADASAPGYLGVFIGQVDVGRPEADSQYGLEYRFPVRWGRFDLVPTAGVLRTRYGSHLAYGGIGRRTPFLSSGAGPALNVGFAAGLYHHRGRSDTDLGFPLQFKSSVGIDHEFPDRTRLGLYFSHISNASLAEENPGTELLTLNYGLAF